MHCMLDGRIKANHIFLIKLAITTGLITYLIYSCNIDMLASSLYSINLPLAGLTFIMLPSILFIGGMNLWLLMNSISRIPLTVFIRAYGYGYAVNLFSPGQLGDISITIFLKKDGVYYSHSTLGYAVDKLISMLFLLVLGFIGARFLLNGFAGPMWVFSIPPICIVCAIACIAFIVYIPNDTGHIGRIKHFINSLHNEAVLWDAKYKAI